MKLEYYIFLSLVLTAAIVTGSTLGVAANFPYIVEQAQKAQAAQLTAQTVSSTLTESEGLDPSVAATPTVATANNSASPVLSTDVMLITAAEKKQIVEMLIMLGMTTENDFSAFIKGFQQKHALDATGLLDSKTLHFIMEEAKLKKAYTRQASL
ncbi:MAG: hypothetical protein ACOX0F_05275 [Syntrophomonadaceae bacterium]|jgi:hypothetical protein